ncbi:hypothetical protein Agub_g3819, partial [Astrephomene gubernaculifera]
GGGGEGSGAGSAGGGVQAGSGSAPAGGAGQHGNSGGSSPIVAVGEARSEAEAVTALALSTVAGPGDPLWLLVGHASGSLAAWDLQRRPPRLVALVAGQHGLPVTHVSFFPGRGASHVLSADRRGRLLLHSFTHIVLKTAVASRVVMDGSLGPLGAIVHLQPFFTAMPPPSS